MERSTKQRGTTRHVRMLSALLLVAGLVGVPAASAAPGDGTAGRDDQSVFKFTTMTPVIEPLTGATHPIRGVPGGGLPWEINTAKAELTRDGTLQVKVDGLVLANRAPVPEPQQGTNPASSFMAVVSCMTVSNGAVENVSVSTEAAPATPTGDAMIEESVELPSPCIAPIVFVTSPTGSWFATTGF